MLSKLILDKLIPLPSEDTEMETLRATLARENYPVTNLKPGGVFYTLVRIFIRVKIELLALLRMVLSEQYITSADSIGWLEIIGAGYSLPLKQAVKTRGFLTLSRTADTATVKIPKGCLFKTTPDTSGEELRFLSETEIVFPIGATVCAVPVVAELAGAAYNVPENRIVRCLLHLESVTGITNATDWITREGADVEGVGSYKSRLLGVWDRNATNPTAGSYKSIAEAVPGVLGVTIHDQHPRGQGTLDIIVTSATGGASDTLLAEVDAAARTIAGPYDDILVKSSVTVAQAIAVTITLPMALSEEGVADTVRETVAALFKIDRSRTLNELYISDLIVAIKQELPTAKGVRVTDPPADLLLESDKVIVPGTVTVTIERV